MRTGRRVRFRVRRWAAVKVLPGVIQRGCAFHFGRAVWRNIQAVSLQIPYTTDDGVNHICRKSLALPFLPANEIPHKSSNIGEVVIWRQTYEELSLSSAY